MNELFKQAMIKQTPTNKQKKHQVLQLCTTWFFPVSVVPSLALLTGENLSLGWWRPWTSLNESRSVNRRITKELNGQTKSYINIKFLFLFLGSFYMKIPVLIINQRFRIFFFQVAVHIPSVLQNFFLPIWFSCHLMLPFCALDLHNVSMGEPLATMGEQPPATSHHMGAATSHHVGAATMGTI